MYIIASSLEFLGDSRVYKPVSLHLYTFIVPFRTCLLVCFLYSDLFFIYHIFLLLFFGYLICFLRKKGCGSNWQGIWGRTERHGGEETINRAYGMKKIF